MSNLEKEREPVKKVYYKFLRLITPELANELGIPAEGPVFISPFISSAKKCDKCSVIYKPLVYQVRNIITPHHFHHPYPSVGIPSVGIFHYRAPLLNSPVPKETSLHYESPWMAFLEPIGRRGYDCSEKVLVKGIITFCDCRRHEFLTELSEGLLYPESSNKGNLEPTCNLELRSPEPRFRFKITEDGSVLFSHL